MAASRRLGLRLLLIALPIAGLACLGIGVWQIIVTSGQPQPTALMGIGALLAASPFLLDRLEAISFGSDGFELRLTKQIADQGAPKTAKLLERTDLARLAESYRIIHEELRGDAYERARVHVQDVLVGRAASYAGEYDFDPGEIKRLFPVAAPVVRVLLVGLMQGDPRLLDAATLNSAIRSPATKNEQFHALKTVRKYWTRFSGSQQKDFEQSIDVVYHALGKDRIEMANEVRALAAGSVRPAPRRRRLPWRRPAS